MVYRKAVINTRGLGEQEAVAIHSIKQLAEGPHKVTTLTIYKQTSDTKTISVNLVNDEIKDLLCFLQELYG